MACRKNRWKNPASGLSVLELMVVLAIAAILLSVAVPNYFTWIDNRKLASAATGIVRALQYARLRAVRDLAPAVVTFDPDGDGLIDGHYQVFVNQGIDRSTWWTREAGEPILVETRLPDDIEIIDASFAGGIPRTRFNRMGFPNGFGGHVYLKNRRGRYMGVHLNLNGNPRLVTSPNGAKGTWE